MTTEVTSSGGWILSGNAEDHSYIEKMSDIILTIAKDLNPNIVYDFGCGYGAYISDLHNSTGVEAIGFEEHPDTTFYHNIREQDLSKPFVLDKKADLTISLEVGEHIPAEYEQVFLDNIANNSGKTVIFSWAVEGQEGHHHVNCKNNDYIILEMQKRGFSFDEKILDIRKDESLLWFNNSLMLFHKDV